VETSQTRLPTLGPGLAILVVVRRQQANPLTAAELVARFHLTSRECEVARLLADGQSNAEIADTLGVTRHTARRHTEAVLRKLVVPSRSAVGPVLRGDRHRFKRSDPAQLRILHYS
jgi:DNA-binding NarL/FixJ family response regulator